MERPNMDKRRIHYFIEGGIIAALYAVLTYALAPFGYGMVQVRVAEALCILPFFTPAAVPGLFVGCVIANFFSPLGWIDIVIGSLATLVAAFLASRTRIKWLVPLPAVLINAVAVGAEISILSMGTVDSVSFLPAAGSVALGQIVACYILGLPLLYLLNRYRKQIFGRA
jgi:uncharacterized membrane protein